MFYCDHIGHPIVSSSPDWLGVGDKTRTILDAFHSPVKTAFSESGVRGAISERSTVVAFVPSGIPDRIFARASRGDCVFDAAFVLVKVSESKLYWGELRREMVN